ncbi:hypothetical protein [Halapricum salinum]|uniref:hypothetical protein n=1 Tax=Halapricum salinum TaxID=1457250 RepID=UPI0010A433CE|nr:hypothetical protein [Halapricum salinum]
MYERERRRKFIKSVGSLSLISSIGIASGKRENSGRSHSPGEGAAFRPSGANGELHEQMSSAFREGGSDEVESVLERADLAYVHDSGTPESSFETDDEVSTMDRYEKSDSELSVASVTIPHTDQISVHVMVDLENVESSVGSATYANDAVGMAFNGDHWSLVGEPDVYAENPHSASFFSDSTGGSGGGLVGEINLSADPLVLPNNSYVELYAELENLDGVAGSILGYYKHTEAFWVEHSIPIDNVSIGIDPLSIDINTDADTLWDIGKFNDPEDALKR